MDYNKNDQTLLFFENIKKRLKDKVNSYNYLERELSITEYIFTIPYEYDINKLIELCESEGIKVWYSSSNDRPGMINYCPLHDKLNFTQKTSDIIIKNNLKILRKGA